MNQNQHIRCSVTSCEHYDRGGCVLNSINVQPCTDCVSHKKEDQSMCSSYKACES